MEKYVCIEDVISLDSLYFMKGKIYEADMVYDPYIDYRDRMINDMTHRVNQIKTKKKSKQFKFGR